MAASAPPMPDDPSTNATPDEAGGRGIDRSRISDSLHQAFAPEPMRFGMAADGLPSPELRTHLPTVAPLSPETFVCLADESEFVIRSRWGEPVASFVPTDVSRAPSGEHYVSFEAALRSRAPFIDILRVLDVRRLRVRVLPVRPQCKFLAQQMTDFQDAADHRMVERLCTARRDDESFFVGLRDTQIHACELRSPRDQASLERIERFNRTKIKLGRERIKETGESFDVDQALADAEERAETESGTGRGIFGER